jgi:succinoglycan biosynthesis protein ExoU
MSVTVIIAAKDAAATIARAVRSALAEPPVTQVIVVDDGSVDETAQVARDADDGTGRLLVEQFEQNRGPSAARNHALDRATADHVAILDADDVIVPGRFARLLAIPDWDVIADNILFVPDGTDLDRLTLPRVAATSRVLSLADFIDGCVQRRSRTRSQLGFLKPVIRRDLLEQPRLRYAGEVRLGEDFLLYVALLRRGARFTLTTMPGYVAVERSTSLTARHRTSDLAALLAAEREILAELDPRSAAATSLADRVADTAAKYALRAFLDTKRSHGLRGGLRWLLERPRDWQAVTTGVLRDKLALVSLRRPRQATSAEPRLLLTRPLP